MAKKFFLGMAVLLSFCLHITAQKNDSLVIKMYSGIGEHTLKPGYRVTIKPNYQNQLYRTKLVKLNPDTLFLKPVSLLSGKKNATDFYDSATHLLAVPVAKIGEIGYYSWQDKVVKSVGVAFGLGTLAFAYSYLNGDGSSVLGMIICPVMSYALLSMKRKTFKTPMPWKLQITKPTKDEFIFH